MSARQATVLERVDRVLRSHPWTIGAIVVVSMVSIAFLQDNLDRHHWLIVTYAVPVSLAAYAIGAGAGIATAVAAAALLVLHAHRLGLTDPDVAFIVTTRL